MAVTMTYLAESINRIFTNNTAKVTYINENESSGEDLGYNIDISKARHELGYNPMFQLEDGLLKLKEEMEGIKV